eukprot:5628824-Lingulodinium_polyedra.AAC.1
MEVRFDGACRYAAPLVDRLPCAKCRKIYTKEFYCNLLVKDKSFYAPVTEKVNHVARAYANEETLAGS